LSWKPIILGLFGGSEMSSEGEEKEEGEKIIITLNRKTLNTIIMALKVYERIADERSIKDEISEITKKLSLIVEGGAKKESQEEA